MVVSKINFSNVVWCDVETGGLDENRWPLLEVAVVKTGPNCDIWAQRRYALQVEGGAKNHCDLWPLRQHTASGLLDECDSERALFAYDVSLKLVDFIRCWWGTPDKHASDLPFVVPWLGGFNPSFDLRWLKRHLPDVAALLDYHTYDVRSATVFADAMGLLPAEVNELGGEEEPRHVAHRAMSDILDAITLTRRYLTAQTYLGHAEQVRRRYRELTCTEEATPITDTSCEELAVDGSCADPTVDELCEELVDDSTIRSDVHCILQDVDEFHRYEKAAKVVVARIERRIRAVRAQPEAELAIKNQSSNGGDLGQEGEKES